MTPSKDISSWGPYPVVWLRWGMKDRPFLDNSEGCESPKVPCGIGWGCPWAPHLLCSFPVQLLPSLPVTGIHLTNPSYESTYILNCVSESTFGKSRPWEEWIGTSFSPKPSQWVFQGIPAEFDICLPGPVRRLVGKTVLRRQEQLAAGVVEIEQSLIYVSQVWVTRQTQDPHGESEELEVAA